MGRLTTHVLDLVHGCPGRNFQLTLYRVDDERSAVCTRTTNDDGRVDSPLMEAASMAVGTYEIVFQAGAYFQSMGIECGAQPFLDEVVIRFGIANADEHYHVPLLLSRFGYSTYRGS